nr:putative ribonuclease H-like domain-containing protein [Tanacetum cinerariifolium]
QHQKGVKKTVSAQQYVLLPLWSTGSQDPHNTDDDAAFDVKENENDVHVSDNESDKTDNKKHDAKAKRDDKGKSPVASPIGVRDLRAELEDFSFNSTNTVNAVSAPVNTVEPNLTNNTNNFNTASPSINAVSLNFRIARKSSFVDPSKYHDDPEMPKLKDIVYSDDEEDVGADADLSNLETNTPVSPIPTTRVHKDHPVNQIISDLNSDPQTRSMTMMGKRAIGSKWVFRNKKNKRKIVIRNKARLVAHGHTQEEVIDYDEVFAPVARIEAIRLFLAYVSFMGFMVYHMDVKSSFLYETIEEKVYVYEPLRFEDPDDPNKVYKVVKALYGLHQAPKAWYKTLANYLLENSFQRGKIDQTLFIKKQKEDILLVQVYVDDIIFESTNKELCKALERLMKDKFQMSSMGELTFFLGLQVKKKDDGIFISQDKYVAKILRKFGFTDVKSASTPIEIEKPFLKDPDGEDVDVHIYSMVRNVDSPSKFLMYPRFLQVLMDNQVDDNLSQDPTSTPHVTPYASPPQEQPTSPHDSTMPLLTTLMETCASLPQKKLEKKKKSKHSGFKRMRMVDTSQRVESYNDTVMGAQEDVVAMDVEPLGRINQEDVNAISKRFSAAEPIVFDDEEVQTLCKPDKDVEEPRKKKVADETLLQESFKKLRAAKVSGSVSTQEIPSNDPKEMTKEDFQNMLEIFLVSEFKVEALQVKYPIIDWEIHTEGFDREDLVALWNFVKEKFSSAVLGEDKEKALWVELKRLFEPDADDVLWKLQRYMHASLTWKLYTDCGVHHVSSTREHDIFMLTEISSWQ